ILAIWAIFQLAGAFAQSAGPSVAVQDLKKGDLILKLDSASIARELVTNQDVVIINGEIEKVVPALQNEIMCFVYSLEPQKLLDGQKFAVDTVKKVEMQNSQRFFITLTDVGLSDAESYSLAIGCRVSGLIHLFTVDELKNTFKNVFSTDN
nr:hypothetical protein [Bacteriovoracaceae bacterium]